MTKLVWGAAGERLYETGVDRGVLYFNDQAHAWPGLVSVDESESTNLQEYYQDGVKYGQIIRNGDFTADINALSAPEAFNEIDGQVRLSPGFYAGEQPRRSFGFSYRSLVGNDTNGTNHGYKIHLVYNAMASPASRSRTTVSDTPETMEMGWNITTVPTSLTGYRPTAHYIIDSTQMEQSLVSVLEGILYGGEGITPRLPTPQELMTMFGAWVSIEPGLPIIFLGKKVRTIKLIENMYTNPSAERVSGASGYTRTNLHTNPAAVNNVGWNPVNGTPASLTGSGLPNGLPDTFRRLTTNTHGGAGFYSIMGTSVLIPGRTYTISQYVRCNVAREVRVGVEMNGVSTQVGPFVRLTPDEWVRIHFTLTIPLGATSANATCYSQDGFVGDLVDHTAMLVEEGNQLHPYIDGNTPHAVGATSAWTGAANNSTSTSSFTTVVRYTNLATNPSFEAASGALVGVYGNSFPDPAGTGVNNFGGFAGGTGTTWTRASQAVSWSTPGTAATATILSAPVSTAPGDMGPFIAQAPLNERYTAVFKYVHSRSTNVTLGLGGTYGNSQNFGQSHPGGQNIAVTAGVPITFWVTFAKGDTAAADVRVRVRPNDIYAGDVWQFSEVDLYEGDYNPNREWFSGSYSPDPDLTPVWTGAANATASRLTAPTPAGTIQFAGRHNIQSVSRSAPGFGGRSLRIIRTGSNLDAAAGSAVMSSTPAMIGKSYTIAAYCIIPPGYKSSEDGIFSDRSSRAIYRLSGSASERSIAPSTPGTHLVRAKVTFNGQDQTVRLGGGGHVGQSVYWDAVTIVEGDVPDLMPFDGVNSYDSDLYSAWTGAANASTSTVSVVGAISVSVGSNRAQAYMSDQWASTGSKSIRITPLEVYSSSSSTDSMTAPGGDTGAMRLGMVAGRTYTASAKIYLPSPQTGILNNQARRIVLFYKIGTGSYQANLSAAAPNVAGVHEVTHTFTVPVGATEAFIRYYNGAAYGGGDVWWDDFVLTPEPVNFFMGGLTPYEVLKQMVIPTWSGIEHGSTSRAEIITSLPSNPQLGEAWDISGTLYVWDGSVWTPYPMPTIPY